MVPYLSAGIWRLVEFLWNLPVTIHLTLAGAAVVSAAIAAALPSQSRFDRTTTFLALIGLALIVTATLTARAGVQYLDLARLAWCFEEMDLLSMRREAILNVLLPVPFAFFGTLATRRPRFILAIVVALAVGIELVQGATGLGTCDPGDALRNAMGGALAVGAAVVLPLTGAAPSRR